MFKKKENTNKNKNKNYKNYCIEAEFYVKQVNKSPNFTSFGIIKIGIWSLKY